MAVLGAVTGIIGGVVLGEIEVATIKAEIAAVQDGVNLSHKADLLIEAIDNVMAYKADPDNHILTYTDVEIVNDWLFYGNLQ
jgi:2-phospho-L-lactate guanylyltransferase (CobY/MobA/RfbA family)